MTTDDLQLHPLTPALDAYRDYRAILDYINDRFVRSLGVPESLLYPPFRFAKMPLLLTDDRPKISEN